MFAIHIAHKRFMHRLHEELLQETIKKTKQNKKIRKQAKDLTRYFTKDIWMVNKHIRKCLTFHSIPLLVIYLQEIKKKKKDLSLNVHSSCIIICQHLEITQMSINKKIDKQVFKQRNITPQQKGNKFLTHYLT